MSCFPSFKLATSAEALANTGSREEVEVEEDDKTKRQVYEPYELQIYSDLTTEHDDSIEILSCQLEAGESIYYKMGSGPTATCKEVVKRFTKREPTKKQRIIARIVMVVFMTMLTMSVLLVIVSLTMAEHIDDLGK